MGAAIAGEDERVASKSQPHLKLVNAKGRRASEESLDWLTGPNVRAEESVIAEIARARNDKLWRVGAVAHRMSTQIKRGVAVLHDSTRGALRRFESMPRGKQILWVATPYVGAASLVGLLMAFEAQDEITPVPIPAALRAAEEAPKIAEPAPAPAPPATPNKTLDKETHQLRAAAILYARPDRDLKIAKIRPQELSVYPTFPTSKGWVLVVTEKGTVGYLETARLEAGPKHGKKAKKKRGRLRRRR